VAVESFFLGCVENPLAAHLDVYLLDIHPEKKIGKTMGICN
jgi:hypothetical protein